MKKHKHTHTHIYKSQRDFSKHDAEKGIKTAFFLNTIFVFVEFFGGLFTNSFAVISDAVHDFGDCIAIACAWFFERRSKKKPDDKYTYGYRRYSLVSAAITSLILVCGSAVVIFGAVERFKEPAEVHGLGMLLLAVLGIIINGVAVIKTSKGKGANEKAIKLHLLEDVLSWVTVLVGGFFVYFLKWNFVDIIISLVIAVYLLVQSIIDLVEVFEILLEKVPEDFSVADYKDALSELPGVSDIHHLHVWTFEGEKIMATVHVRIPESADMQIYKEIKKSIEKLSWELGVDHLTVQLDVDECNKAYCDMHK